MYSELVRQRPRFQNRESENGPSKYRYSMLSDLHWAIMESLNLPSGVLFIRARTLASQESRRVRRATLAAYHRVSVAAVKGRMTSAVAITSPPVVVHQTSRVRGFV